MGYAVAPEGYQRGVAIGKGKKGKNDDVLFMSPGYNGIGDTYVDNEKLSRFSYHNGTQSSPRAYKAWVPTDAKKTE